MTRRLFRAGLIANIEYLLASIKSKPDMSSAEEQDVLRTVAKQAVKFAMATRLVNDATSHAPEHLQELALTMSGVGLGPVAEQALHSAARDIVPALPSIEPHKVIHRTAVATLIDTGLTLVMALGVLSRLCQSGEPPYNTAPFIGHLRPVVLQQLRHFLEALDGIENQTAHLLSQYGKPGTKCPRQRTLRVRLNKALTASGVVLCKPDALRSFGASKP